MNRNWHRYFIEHAKLCATKSKDRSTKVGAVLVGPDNEIRSTGYNGFPRGVCDDIENRHERPAKYLFTEHAERNTILNAARIGTPTKGCRLYLNFAPTPCADCTRAIIQAGIVEVIGPDVPFTGKGTQWEEQLVAAREMLIEGGVRVIVVDDAQD